MKLCNVALRLPTQAHADITAPIRTVKGRIPIPRDIQDLMVVRKPHVEYDFLDPTDVLMRMLLLSPLAADPNNLCFWPRQSPQYEDYCDGARLARITAALPPGTAALTSIIFFDEINRDEKGFETGDGGIVVGGFFTRAARESTYAKAHFITFAQLHLPKVSYLHFYLFYLPLRTYLYIFACSKIDTCIGSKSSKKDYAERNIGESRSVILAFISAAGPLLDYNTMAPSSIFHER